MENSCLHKNLYVNVHRRVIHTSQKVEISQCPLSDELIKKMQYIHTTEYSAIHRNEVPIYATTWINFKNILSKRNQTQRPCPCLGKTIETESKFVGREGEQ